MITSFRLPNSARALTCAATAAALASCGGGHHLAEYPFASRTLAVVYIAPPSPELLTSYYDLTNSHVLPALIRKMHEAVTHGEKEVAVWGTGAPRREFLYSDDMADACVHLLDLPDPSFEALLTESDPPLVNIGCGEDLTIAELAMTIARVVGFAGTLHFDTSKPDGTPRKLLDVSRIHSLGWRARTSLQTGIELGYRDFLGLQSR